MVKISPLKIEYFRMSIFLTFLSITNFSCVENNIFNPEKNNSTIFKDIPNLRILNIPTYDGSNQAVHPDILFFEDGLNGHYFYLTMTPYPNSNDKFENPSILVSENGFDFYEEIIGLNPLVDYPKDGHNDDPDIIYIDELETFLIYYLETIKPDSQNVMMLKSQNGINWDKERLIHYDLHNGDHFIVSPAVLQTNDKFYMFYVNISLPGHPIQFLTSVNGTFWDKDSLQNINTKLPEELIPWHIDVFTGPDKYYMLCSGPYNDSNLYLATSTDLIEWSFIKKPILKNSNSYFLSKKIYRSSGLINNQTLIIWFSFSNYAGEWHIGVKKYSLIDIFN